MADLLTKSDIAGFTGIAVGDIDDNVIVWAKAKVESTMAKTFDTLTETESFKIAEPVDYLKLKHQSIISIELFNVEDVDETDPGLTEADDDFDLYKLEGIIYYDFPRNKTITIEYTYGNDDVEDIDNYLMLLYSMKMILLNNASVIPAGAVSEKIGDYTIKYNAAELKSNPEMIDLEIQAILDDQTDLHFF